MFKGMGVALVTPFTPTKKIDYDALGNIVEHLIAGRADYIVVLGTTGENPTLSAEESVLVRTFVKDCANGKIPLVAGMGSNSTAALTDTLKRVDLSGYDAILSVVPFYNKPSQEGLFMHYSAVAQASQLPVILYNVPGRTGTNMTADTTLRIAAANPNVIGVKEASGKIDQIQQIAAERRDGFLLLSGDDGLTFDMMGMGADGVISVLGNAYPKEFGEMTHLLLEGANEKALRIHKNFEELYKMLFAEGNPAGIKALLEIKGLCNQALRLPLTRVSDELYQCIKSWEESYRK